MDIMARCRLGKTVGRSSPLASVQGNPGGRSREPAWQIVIKARGTAVSEGDDGKAAGVRFRPKRSRALPILIGHAPDDCLFIASPFGLEVGEKRLLGTEHRDRADDR